MDRINARSRSALLVSIELLSGMARSGDEIATSPGSGVIRSTTSQPFVPSAHPGGKSCFGTISTLRPNRSRIIMAIAAACGSAS